MAYHDAMAWTSRFDSHPQFGQAIRYATGRSSWVLKATGAVAALALLVPAIALALLLAAAAMVIFTAWVVFSAIDRLLRAFTPGDASQSPEDDGRENVRVIQRS